jgi:hypothetical protein
MQAQEIDTRPVFYLKNPGTSLCPNNLCINLLCLACLSKRCMTMRCCGEMRGLSQPDERVAMTRRGLGSMLAVDEERSERAENELVGFADLRCVAILVSVLLSAIE